MLKFFQEKFEEKEKLEANIEKMKVYLAKKQKETNTLEERLNNTEPIDELIKRRS